MQRLWLSDPEMRRFLYQDFISIVETIIDNIEKALGLCVEKEFKLFYVTYIQNR